MRSLILVFFFLVSCGVTPEEKSDTNITVNTDSRSFDEEFSDSERLLQSCQTISENEDGTVDLLNCDG